MKKQILLMCFLLTGVMYAQKNLSKDYSYTISEPYKVFDGSKFYFSKDNQVMTVKVGGKEVLIQKLDGTGDKVKFKGEKTYEDFPKNQQVEAVREYNDKYYYFYSSWDGGSVDNEQLFVREIDFDKGEFKGEGKLLFKVDGKVTGSPMAVGNFGITIGVQDKFDFLTSFESKKMLIQYRRKPEVKNDKKSFDIIGMVTFDENLNQISKAEVTMPYTERRMDNLDYSIDNEGNAYILAKVYHDDSNKDKKRKKDEEANYHIELFRINEGSSEINITPIEAGSTFMQGLWLYESPHDYMVCAGFYNKGKGTKTAGYYASSGSSVDGIVVFKVGKEGDIYDIVKHEIPLEVMNVYLSERAQKKNIKKDEDGEIEFGDLVLKELQVGSDGSLLLIGERDYMIWHQSSKYSYYTYHYEDLLVTKITPSGEVAWMRKIPKKQKGSVGKGGMSYRYMFANGYHYLLFLDNVKNYNLSENLPPALHTDGKGGYFTSYKISDADGTMVNSSVFNVREMDDMELHQFATSRIVKLSDNTFAVEFYKKKKEDVMVKVIMK